MATSIVTVNASVVTAPIPNTLQRRGAFVTQGGTNTAPGTFTQLTGTTDLTPILAASKNIASLTWLANVVTVTTAAAHGWNNGDQIQVTIAGAAPAGYNGTYTATVTGTTTLTYPLLTNPGTETTPGTITLYAVTQLQQMATTYFAGNGVPAVWVLELGEGSVSAGVTELTTVIADVKGTSDQKYAYLMPREWDANEQYLAFLTNYTAVNAMQYFYTTTTVTNRASYTGLKCVFAIVESPNVAATEFSCASPFGNAIKQQPSSTNKVVPMAYSPSYGTTAYPTRGNQTIFNELSADFIGWIGTGQEGGITSNIVFQGIMADGNDWNFWYSVDWAQIQMAQALANEVIIGSSTSLNPLYYNQIGINRLQTRLQTVASNGVSYGVGNGQVVVTKLPTAQFVANYNAGLYANQIVINAEPFTTYTSGNPNDYGVGRYGGLSCIWIPQVGFRQIIFALNATTFTA